MSLVEFLEDAMSALYTFFFPNPADVIPLWMDLLAVLVGSLSGALVGTSKKLDLIGVVSCAFLTGLGGGLIRDVTMQVGTVYFLDSYYAIPISLITGIVVFYFHEWSEEVPNLIEWIDISSVALFVIVGSDKAVAYSLSPLAVIFMGTMTGVGGGMLRDSLIGETPRIFKKSNFYAVCAVLGSIVFLVIYSFIGWERYIATISCFLSVVILRRLSLRYNWQSPADVELSHKLKRKRTSTEVD